MMNDKQNKLIPKLRFPEFKNSGEWEIKSLSDLLDYERPDKYIVSDTNYKNEGIPVLTANKSFILGYTDENFGIYNKLPAIIFDDFTVDNKYVDFPFKVKSSAIKILTTKGKDDLKFVYELISQIKFDAIQHKRYYISQYQNLKVPVPQPPEQQKIASCLSSLDELLEAHKQKLELLKAHKKGLMQKLFPQEGEKVPKLRFPEFKNSGEWKIEPLGNISKKINEKTKGRKFKLMSITAGEGLVSQIEKFGREIAGNSYKNYYVIHKNDFAYNKSSTKYYPQGEIAMYEDEEIGAVPNSIFTCFRFNEEIIYPTFAKYHFINNLHGKWLLNFITIGARAHGALQVNEKDLFSVPFPFPSLAEQQKIAECLSSVDKLITAEAEKIEQLEKHKKGLMQGLFPEIN